MKEINVDICIIGGGASGLIAAIKAADTNPEASIVVLEKLEEVGRKVAASGNGRCNLSNIESPDWEKTSLFFSSIGLFTRVDSEGRVYPYSEDGRDVVATLKNACEKRGVEIITGREVVEILHEEKGINDFSFLVNASASEPSGEALSVYSKKVLIATGGKSKPKMGTTGDGFWFAKSLGHSVTPLIPVLTGVEIDEFLHESEGLLYKNLSGIRQKASVTLRKKRDDIFREYGEIQFTDYGVSGICIFNLSRFIEGRDFSLYEIVIDFAPEFNDRVTLDSLSSIVKKPLAECILKINEDRVKEGDPSHEDLLHHLKNFTLHPSGLRGWDMAQVTRGGVPLTEINEHTGESTIVPGLYFSGEMLDLDYRCGGFNLQNAWTTGLRAGEAMAINR